MFINGEMYDLCTPV